MAWGNTYLLFLLIINKLFSQCMSSCSCLLDLQHSYHGKYQISINQIQFGQTHIRRWVARTHRQAGQTLVSCASNMSLFQSQLKYLLSPVVICRPTSIRRPLARTRTPLGLTICPAYLSDLACVRVWVPGCACVFAFVIVFVYLIVISLILTSQHTHTHTHLDSYWAQIRGRKDPSLLKGIIYLRLSFIVYFVRYYMGCVT